MVTAKNNTERSTKCTSITF